MGREEVCIDINNALVLHRSILEVTFFARPSLNVRFAQIALILFQLSVLYQTWASPS